MIPDKLYDLAFAFKMAKPWKILHPAQFFAVIPSDGKPRFCQVFGGDTGKPSLWLHNTEQSFQAYVRMVHTPKITFYNKIDYLVDQEAYIINFDNKAALAPSELDEVQAYLKKRKLKPSGSGFYPVLRVTTAQHRTWMYRDEADVERTFECLDMVMQIIDLLLDQTVDRGEYLLDLRLHQKDKKLAVPAIRCKDGTLTWEVINVSLGNGPKNYQPRWNDLQVARMKKAKKTGAIWIADHGRLPEALINEGAQMNEYGEAVNAPFFPEMLAVFDEASGELLFMETSSSDKDLYGSITKNLMSTIIELGRPMTIRVRNSSTEALLKGLCTKLGIKLDRREVISELDDFRCDIHAQWMEAQGYTEEEIDRELGIVFDGPEFKNGRRKMGQAHMELLDSIAESILEGPESATDFIKLVVNKGLLMTLPNIIFDNVVDAILLFDISPKLEKQVKEEFRRRYYEDEFYDDFDDGEDEY